MLLHSQPACTVPCCSLLPFYLPLIPWDALCMPAGKHATCLLSLWHLEGDASSCRRKRRMWSFISLSLLIISSVSYLLSSLPPIPPVPIYISNMVLPPGYCMLLIFLVSHLSVFYTNLLHCLWCCCCVWHLDCVWNKRYSKAHCCRCATVASVTYALHFGLNIQLIPPNRHLVYLLRPSHLSPHTHTPHWFYFIWSDRHTLPCLWTLTLLLPLGSTWFYHTLFMHCAM